MAEEFFNNYAPSELYASIGCEPDYVTYEDENITHLDILAIFPSEGVFKLKMFMDMCRQHHASSDLLSGYEEVWTNGVLRARGGFVSGQPCGCWRFFHDNGRCAEVVH